MPAPSRESILVVEDNPSLSEVLVGDILPSLGYEAFAVGSGRGALEFIEQSPPTMLLLDISLPLMDGLEIVGRLKVDPSVRHIPVVAVTASAMVGDRERFLAAGCDDYLAKPVHAHELVEKVQYYLQEDAPTQDS